MVQQSSDAPGWAEIAGLVALNSNQVHVAWQKRSFWEQGWFAFCKSEKQPVHANNETHCSGVSHLACCKRWGVVRLSSAEQNGPEHSQHIQ